MISRFTRFSFPEKLVVRDSDTHPYASVAGSEIRRLSMNNGTVTDRKRVGYLSYSSAQWCALAHN